MSKRFWLTASTAECHRPDAPSRRKSTARRAAPKNWGAAETPPAHCWKSCRRAPRQTTTYRRRCPAASTLARRQSAARFRCPGPGSVCAAPVARVWAVRAAQSWPWSWGTFTITNQFSWPGGASVGVFLEVMFTYTVTSSATVFSWKMASNSLPDNQPRRRCCAVPVPEIRG